MNPAAEQRRTDGHNPIISLADISFRYPGQAEPVFDGLSLDIPPGAIAAILGPNGSGKTTLLHLILGFLEPGSGVILLAQRRRDTYSRRDIGKLIGLVSQDEYIPFNFTVLEYVLLGRAPHLQLLQTPKAQDMQVACSAIEDVGMRAFEGRSIQSLSGGERQLVMIARALAQQPRILLLDEPTSHLDLANKSRVLALLQQLAKQGVTVIFTTHEPELAASIAEYVVLMRAGKALAAGTASTVLTSAQLSATYGVSVEVAELAGRRVILPPW